MKKKNKKYPFGGNMQKMAGNLSSNFAGAVVDQSLSSIGDLISQLKNNNSNYPVINQNTTQYAMGGGLKKFNAPSHQQGGQTINEFGKPDMSGQAEIQGQETFKDGYVFSDVLTNPETGNKFNKDSMKLEKKYSKNEPMEFDNLSKNAFEFDTGRLKKINDIVRENAEMRQQLQGMEQSPEQNTQQLTWGGGIDGSNILRGMAESASESLSNSSGQEPYSQNYLNNLNPFDLNTIRKNSANKATYGDYKEGSGNNVKEANGINLNNFNASDVLRGITLAGDLKDSLTPALKENPIVSNYVKGDLASNRMSSDLSQAVNNIMASRNAQNQNIDNSSTSVNVGIARKTQVGANTQNALANVAAQERQMSNSISQYITGREDMKAGTLQAQMYQNNVDNLQNDAAQHSFSERVRDDFLQVAKDMDMRKVAKMELEEFIAVTKSLGYNFNLDDSKAFLQAIKEGKSPIKFEQ